MPFVVVDTSISLPATLSPRGMMRRFWVVLALGALTYEVEHGRLELNELSRQAEREGGTVRGVGKARARIEQANDRRAAIRTSSGYDVSWRPSASSPRRPSTRPTSRS